MRLSDRLLLQQVDDDVMVLMDESTGAEIVFSKVTLRLLVERGAYFLEVH